MEPMQWIIPITVLPGIALIVMSTSNILLSLNNEVTVLNKEKEKYREIIRLKLTQMKRLNWSLVLLYIGILIFLVSGVLGAITDPQNIYTVFSMVAGVVVLIMAIVLLIVFGFKSINIRKRHLSL
jgi:quinol-cytochrome oxidoreductase complex cytochrome b subunit